MSHSHAQDEASRLLSHYIQSGHEIGLHWTSDNNTEVDEIVDLIVEAAYQKHVLPLKQRMELLAIELFDLKRMLRIRRILPDEHEH